MESVIPPSYSLHSDITQTIYQDFKGHFKFSGGSGSLAVLAKAKPFKNKFHSLSLIIFVSFSIEEHIRKEKILL